MSWCEFPGCAHRQRGHPRTMAAASSSGLGVTMQLVAISVVLGCVLAFGLALARIYGGPVSARLALAYTTFFRGTPLLCQLFLVYYGAGQFRPLPRGYRPVGFFRDAFYCAVFTFTLNTAAYQAEIFRGAHPVRASRPMGGRAGARHALEPDPAAGRRAAGGDRGAAAARQRAGHHGEVVGASPRW